MLLQCAVGTFQLSTAIQRAGLAPCFSIYLVFLSSFPKTDGIYGGTVVFAGIYGYSFTISKCPEHFKIINYTINLLSVFPIFCYYSGIMDFVFGTYYQIISDIVVGCLSQFLKNMSIKNMSCHSLVVCVIKYMYTCRG